MTTAALEVKKHEPILTHFAAERGIDHTHWTSLDFSGMSQVAKRIRYCT